MTTKQLHKVKYLAAYSKKARTRKKNEKRLRHYYRCAIQAGVDGWRLPPTLIPAIVEAVARVAQAAQEAVAALIHWQQSAAQEQGVTKIEDNEPVLRLPGP